MCSFTSTFLRVADFDQVSINKHRFSEILNGSALLHMAVIQANTNDRVNTHVDSMLVRFTCLLLIVYVSVTAYWVRVLFYGTG